MRSETVSNWMTKEIITITPDTTLTKAHQLMTDHKIRRLPVINEGRLVGILSLGDLREAEANTASSLNFLEISYLLDHQPVESAMTKNPITIAPDASLSETAWVMLKHKVSGIPVVDDAMNVVGIITESDIFRLVVERWDDVAVSVTAD